MEVKPAEEIPQQPVEEEEAVIIEPPAPAWEETDRGGILALLADYWIWMVAFLVGLSVVSAASWFVLAPKGEQQVDELDLKGLSVTRYSDEAEVGEEE